MKIGDPSSTEKHLLCPSPRGHQEQQDHHVYQDHHDYERDGATYPFQSRSYRDGLGAPGPLDARGALGVPSFGRFDELTKALVRRAEAFASDVVRRRAVPLRRLHFELARELIAIPGVRETVAECDRVLWAPAAAFCRLLDAHPHDAYDDDWSEGATDLHFMAVVDAFVKMRTQGDALVTAFAHAEAAPGTLLPPADGYGPRFALIIGTAWHLQNYVDDKPIMLPVARLARLLGLRSHGHVSPIIATARRHDLLRRESAGTYAKKMAATYHFNRQSHLYLPPGFER